MLMQHIRQSVTRRIRYAMLLPRAEYCQSGAASSSVNSESHPKDDYEEAIKTLNTLQSNAASIRNSARNKKAASLEDTVKFLKRSGITLEELDKLPVIHVSGTKGKGSTCALTESILRAYGVRTGFFSSPHLVSVTERIRINGKSISEQKFVQTFWKVFDKLEKNKESDQDMPTYFKFLTILCFHVFFEEKVDVAVLEVGIGGQYDSTNVVRNTSTVGITSLGLEHTNLLGETIEEIATQKAGIIKQHSTVFHNITLPKCVDIIEAKAKENNAKLFKVPEISEYKWPKHTLLSKFNKMIQLNGSLAIQLAYSWLNHCYLKKSIPDKVTLNIPRQVMEGIQNCVWPGRCQSMDYHNYRIHLDGAHTRESMHVCLDWFDTITVDSQYPKVLIFNATGERDSRALLKILHNRVPFNFACFVPNIPLKSNLYGDLHSAYNNQEQIQRAELHQTNWIQFSKSKENRERSRIFDSVLDALKFLGAEYPKERVDILVTGSIHLLGATILALNEFDKQS